MAAAVDGAEVVFHLAAARAVLRSVHQRLATDRVNTAGTSASWRRPGYAAGVISTSSSSVYGGAAVTQTPRVPHAAACPIPLRRLQARGWARRGVLGAARLGDRVRPVVQRLRAPAAPRRPAARGGDPHLGRHAWLGSPRRRRAEPDFTYVDDASPATWPPPGPAATCTAVATTSPPAASTACGTCGRPAANECSGRNGSGFGTRGGAARVAAFPHGRPARAPRESEAIVTGVPFGLSLTAWCGYG